MCDQKNWKWAVVALHSAAQGFLVLSLRKGNNLLVQKPSHAKTMLAALEGGSGSLEPYMDNFIGLYRKARDPANFVGCAPPVPSDLDLEADMKAFDQMRHDFLHFNSKGLSISRSFMRSRCNSALSLVAQLLQSRVIFWHDEDFERQSLAQLGRAQRSLSE
ncbi:hypothetical protein [Lysobacter sp. ESA13C]|uniref:hypothetical protein n=1 Tax=Lysobacter sp. ESA13C TaxID=2862676 RepID=UPI001CBEEC1B|nr:hypothetical protein [Lysobacter sp. ESA13C]